MNLYLASQLDVSGKKFLDVSGMHPADTTVAYVPTARNFKKKVLDDSTTLQWFRRKKFQVDVVDVEKVDSQTAEKKIRAADVIFMEGGNSFYLLEKLKQSGMFEVIGQEVRSGKWYVGSSAGSVVAAPDIRYTTPIDDPQAALGLDTTGFGFVTRSIIPHIGDSKYSSPNAGKIRSELGKDFDLLELTDSQALVRVGDNEYVA